MVMTFFPSEQGEGEGGLSMINFEAVKCYFRRF